MPEPSDRPTGLPQVTDGRAVPHLATDADAVPDFLPQDATRRRRALDAVSDALARVPLSLEAVRAAAVRYGNVARDAGQAADEMAAALAAQVRRVAARRGTAELGQLGASVAWWGAHGYHRAD